jgi:hypothetical protein
MTRSSHPKKEIEAALKHAEEEGWRVEVGGSHAWGKIYCPYNDDECRCGEFCIASVWSTPRNPAVTHEHCAGWWTSVPLTSAGTMRNREIELWNIFLP